MKISVLIPTYNEAKEIGRIIKEIKQQDLDVIVVDDGSSDNTFQIAQKSGAIAQRNQINEGKGASLIKGFAMCLSRGYDAVITMDGDGQHLPQDLPRFIRRAGESDSQILIGNRMQDTGSMPWLRIHTNQLMSDFISLIAKQKIPDSQCGFRLIKKDALEKMKLVTKNYEIESEILIKAARLRFKIESIPITTVYSGEKSNINPFVDTLRFVRLIMKELWSGSR